MENFRITNRQYSYIILFFLYASSISTIDLLASMTNDFAKVPDNMIQTIFSHATQSLDVNQYTILVRRPCLFGGQPSFRMEPYTSEDIFDDHIEIQMNLHYLLNEYLPNRNFLFSLRLVCKNFKDKINIFLKKEENFPYKYMPSQVIIKKVSSKEVTKKSNILSSILNKYIANITVITDNEYTIRLKAFYNTDFYSDEPDPLAIWWTCNIQFNQKSKLMPLISQIIHGLDKNLTLKKKELELPSTIYGPGYGERGSYIDWLTELHTSKINEHNFIIPYINFNSPILNLLIHNSDIDYDYRPSTQTYRTQKNFSTIPFIKPLNLTISIKEPMKRFSLFALANHYLFKEIAWADNNIVLIHDILELNKPTISLEEIEKSEALHNATLKNINKLAHDPFEYQKAYSTAQKALNSMKNDHAYYLLIKQSSDRLTKITSIQNKDVTNLQKNKSSVENTVTAFNKVLDNCDAMEIIFSYIIFKKEIEFKDVSILKKWFHALRLVCKKFAETISSEKEFFIKNCPETVLIVGNEKLAKNKDPMVGKKLASITIQADNEYAIYLQVFYNLTRYQRRSDPLLLYWNCNIKFDEKSRLMPLISQIMHYLDKNSPLEKTEIEFQSKRYGPGHGERDSYIDWLTELHTQNINEHNFIFSDISFILNLLIHNPNINYDMPGSSEVYRMQTSFAAIPFLKPLNLTISIKEPMKRFSLFALANHYLFKEIAWTDNNIVLIHNILELNKPTISLEEIEKSEALHNDTLKNINKIQDRREYYETYITAQKAVNSMKNDHAYYLLIKQFSDRLTKITSLQKEKNEPAQEKKFSYTKMAFFGALVGASTVFIFTIAYFAFKIALENMKNLKPTSAKYSGI